jgi:hypothetical protein
MSLRRLMTMLRRSSSILRISARMVLPMNSPMSLGRRTSTCEAGRKTGTPMSTSRPPLIFRMPRAFDDVAFGLGRDRSQPRMRSALRLESFTMPESSSTASSSTSTVSPVEFVEVVELALVDQAFGLEPDLDDDVVAGLADDLALQDRAGLEVLNVALKQRLHVAAGDLVAVRVLQKRVDLVVVKTDLLNEIVVNHGKKSPGWVHKDPATHRDRTCLKCRTPAQRHRWEHRPGPAGPVGT